MNYGPFINNPTHEHLTLHKEPDNNHRKSEENNAHKSSEKKDISEQEH